MKDNLKFGLFMLGVILVASSLGLAVLFTVHYVHEMKHVEYAKSQGVGIKEITVLGIRDGRLMAWVYPEHYDYDRTGDYLIDVNYCKWFLYDCREETAERYGVEFNEK